MKQKIYYILKAMIFSGGILSLYFASHLWIGTKSEWDEAVGKILLEFILSRFTFTLIIGVVFFLLSLMLDQIFRKVVVWSPKKAALEILLIVILSFVFVALAIFK